MGNLSNVGRALRDEALMWHACDGAKTDQEMSNTFFHIRPLISLSILSTSICSRLGFPLTHGLSLRCGSILDQHCA